MDFRYLLSLTPLLAFARLKSKSSERLRSILGSHKKEAVGKRNPGITRRPRTATMPHGPHKLTHADMHDLATALAFVLRFDGCKRVRKEGCSVFVGGRFVRPFLLTGASGALDSRPSPSAPNRPVSGPARMGLFVAQLGAVRPCDRRCHSCQPERADAFQRLFHPTRVARPDPKKPLTRTFNRSRQMTLKIGSDRIAPFRGVSEHYFARRRWAFKPVRRSKAVL
jgi:hypothetical protein